MHASSILVLHWCQESDSIQSLLSRLVGKFKPESQLINYFLYYCEIGFQTLNHMKPLSSQFPVDMTGDS